MYLFKKTASWVFFSFLSIFSIKSIAQSTTVYKGRCGYDAIDQ